MRFRDDPNRREDVHSGYGALMGFYTVSLVYPGVAGCRPLRSDEY